MESAIFTDGEYQVTAERALKYQGTAKINLNEISLHSCLTQEYDPKNVARLCEVFRKDGCRRLDLRNHVTGVVSKQSLKRARQAASVSKQDLMTNPPDRYPHLHFQVGDVKCLHGQHRLKAASDILPLSERWWTVDLYRDDISEDLRNTLHDEYANEKIPSDGEIYRKIRQYQHEHNARFQKRWWSRLSENKSKRLRQLTSPDYVDLCAAFDALLPIPGLWNGMSIGSLNRVLALKCDEELIHYLAHVRNYWAILVDHDPIQMAKIDLHTVETLQLRAPTASQADARAVKGSIKSGEVFAKFTDAERKRIWKRLRSKEACDCIVPSLHTFFRDVLYLELCANGVKRLATLSKNQPTVRRAMRHTFRHNRSEEYPIQTTEASFYRTADRQADQFELGYRQVWLFAMRHYPDMPKERTTQNIIAKSNRGKADEAILHGMAALAQKLGFQSPRVRELVGQCPDRQIAQEALLKARKPSCYQYDSVVLESLIDRIVECFAAAVPLSGPSHSNLPALAPLVRNRCGLPSEQSQAHDRSLLFLDQVHSMLEPSDANVSSFFVRQCVYFAFFGKPSTTRAHRQNAAAEKSPDGPGSPLFVPHNHTVDIHQPQPGTNGVRTAANTLSDMSSPHHNSDEGAALEPADEDRSANARFSPLSAATSEGRADPEISNPVTPVYLPAPMGSWRQHACQSDEEDPGSIGSADLHVLDEVPPVPPNLQSRPASSEAKITITFWVYRDGRWLVVNEVPVKPSDPSNAELLAKEYAMDQSVTFYTRLLRTVSVTNCVRAALKDGINTIFMSFEGRPLTEPPISGVKRKFEEASGTESS